MPTTVTTNNTTPTGYVAIPRDLLVEAVQHLSGERFDYPKHHVAPKLRPYLGAQTLAHCTRELAPMSDIAALANVLRNVAVLVHVDELEQRAGRLIVTTLLPHVTSDQFTELAHTAGMHHDLDNAVIHWNEYDDSLPPQDEDRQAVATDLAERDLEVLIWGLLNPGETHCVDCLSPAERIAAAAPGKTVCELHLARRKASVDAMRTRQRAEAAR